MDGDSIEIAGLYQVQDFLRFRIYTGLRFVWPVILLLLAISLLGLLWLIGAAQQDRSAALELALIPLFWSALLVAPQPFAAKRQFNSQPYLKETVSFRFDAEGMHSKSAAGTGEARWPAFHHVREMGSMFVLYTAPNLGSLLPKRFFKNAEELTAFRRLVSAGIAPKKLGRPGIWSRWW